MTIDGTLFLGVFIGIIVGHILVEVGKYIFRTVRARREQKRFQKIADEAWRKIEDEHKKED
jgi:hypothetical protein